MATRLGDGPAGHLSRNLERLVFYWWRIVNRSACGDPRSCTPIDCSRRWRACAPLNLASTPVDRVSETVFISSVIGGFEAVRQATREAVESLGMRPVMAEMAGARPQSSQHALLGEVAGADIYLLLLGARYGEPGASGVSPTGGGVRGGEAAEQADRHPSPGRRDGAAAAGFLRAPAGAGRKVSTGTSFTDERDVGMKVVRALTNVRQLGDVRELAPQAQTRAVDLARGEQQAGYGYAGGGSQALIAFVPLTDMVFLDELALDDATLPDRLSELARSTGLVSQASSIMQDARRGAITLEAGHERSGQEASIVIGENGEIVVKGSVAGEDPHFGTSRIDPEKLTGLVERAGRYATGVWRQIDPRGQVQQAAVAVGIPEASMKVYGRPKAPSSSLSMGGMTRLQGTVMAPEPALIVRRVDVEGEEMRQRLVAAVRRVFADAGSIEAGS